MLSIHVKQLPLFSWFSTNSFQSLTSSSRTSFTVFPRPCCILSALAKISRKLSLPWVEVEIALTNWPIWLLCLSVADNWLILSEKILCLCFQTMNSFLHAFKPSFFPVWTQYIKQYMRSATLSFFSLRRSKHSMLTLSSFFVTAAISRKYTWNILKIFFNTCLHRILDIRCREQSQEDSW